MSKPTATTFREPCLRAIGTLSGLSASVEVEFDAIQGAVCTETGIAVDAHGEDKQGNPQVRIWINQALNKKLRKEGLVEKVGSLAGAPDGKHAQDPVLHAVEKKHAGIEGRAKTKTFDMKQLKQRLPKELKGFAGAPGLRAGRIAPTRWGLVKLGASQGVFIEYGTCLEKCDKNMLMAFNTKDEPHLETVESNGKHYWMTRHEDHTLASWRSESDGWLYVLVTHCPFRNALALAQLLRD